jgi:hypothetical protein
VKGELICDSCNGCAESQAIGALQGEHELLVRLVARPRLDNPG